MVMRELEYLPNRPSSGATIKIPRMAVVIIDDNFAIREVVTDIITFLLKITVRPGFNFNKEK